MTWDLAFLFHLTMKISFSPVSLKYKLNFSFSSSIASTVGGSPYTYQLYSIMPTYPLIILQMFSINILLNIAVRYYLPNRHLYWFLWTQYDPKKVFRVSRLLYNFKTISFHIITTVFEQVGNLLHHFWIYFLSGTFTGWILDPVH